MSLRRKFTKEVSTMSTAELVNVWPKTRYPTVVGDEMARRAGKMPLTRFLGMETGGPKLVSKSAEIPYKSWGKLSPNKFAADIADHILVYHPNLGRVQRQHLEWYLKNHAHTLGDLKARHHAVYESLMRAITSYYSEFDKANPYSPHTRKNRDARRKRA
jgi:hypothetical protein